MKTRRKLKSCPAILLFVAVVSGLPAQIPGDPTVPRPGDAELPGSGGAIAPPPDAPAIPGSPGKDLIAPQLSDPNLPGAGPESPSGAPPAFLQIPAPIQIPVPIPGTKSVSPPGAQPLIGRQLRAGELGPWTAAQATGAPNTLTMGDFSTAWAAANADANEEWLSVQFTLEADLDRVRVVQSYNPGAITKVTAERSDGQPVVLEEVKTSPGAEIPATPEAVARHARHRKQAGTADPATPPVVAEFVPPAGTTLRTTSVRITIDERKFPGWNEIDAVEIVSRNGARQWAQAAKASSSFGDRYAYESLQNQQWSTGSTQASAEAERLIAAMEARLQVATRPLLQSESNAAWKGLPWSPEQATGAPDTPVAGDYPTAWAPLTYGGSEWLDVTFARPADLRELRIVESSQTHAITTAQAYANGVLVPLAIKKAEPGRVPADGASAPPSGIPPAQDSSAPETPAPHIVSAWPESASLPAVQKVRIELESAGLTTWPEIDAVELVGTDGSRQWAAKAEASSTYARRLSRAATVPRGYQRATTLDEANQRIEDLTRRLEQLEAEMQRSKRAADAPNGPAAGGPVPGSKPLVN